MAGRDWSLIAMIIAAAVLLLLYSFDLTMAGEEEVVEEAAEETDDVFLRSLPSRGPSPSPSPIAGPAAMMGLRGKCFSVTGKDGNGHDSRYEVCPYRSVRQIVVHTGNSYNCGYWSGWNTKEEGGKTQWLSQRYERGESCGDTRRTVTVTYTCKADARGVEMVTSSEPKMCQYSLTLASKEWCDVEKEMK